MAFSADDGLPTWVGAGLDMDVARWLLIRADRKYGGSMEQALNDTVRTVMAQEAPAGSFRYHAGLGLPCTPCGGRCVVDDLPRAPEPGS